MRKQDKYCILFSFSSTRGCRPKIVCGFLSMREKVQNLRLRKQCVNILFQLGVFCKIL